MEVRDIFAMRKEGRAEEAYAEISKLYAVHHGPHTTLCMFWCASDLLRLRAKEENAAEVRRLLGQMVTIYPSINDEDCRGARAVSIGALAMDKLVEDFNLVFFMPWFERLPEDDWQAYTANGHVVPSLGQQIVNHLMRDLQKRDLDYVNKVIGLFRKAIQHAPHYKMNLRHYAQLHSLLGDSDKALETYKMLLRRYHDGYLYGELARLVADDAQKIALYSQAILHQNREEFRAKYHLELALLLMRQRMQARAAYELGRCIDIRKKYGHALTPFLRRQLARLQGVVPIDRNEEKILYDRSKAVVDAMLK